MEHFENENPSVCVMGCGYIGLPTMAMFSKHGCRVLGVDVSERIVNKINKGEIHIEEPGLAEIVKEAVEKGLMSASLVPQSADVFIIAVPTPNNNDEYLSCDLTYVKDAAHKIVPYLQKGSMIIVESTMAPRSTDDHIKPIIEKAGFVIGEDVYLAHCPERVLPGKILYELTHNNRIVGGITPTCAEKIAQVYDVFVQGEIIKTSARTAEMSKCMENTFRDVNIALANELAKICDHLDIDALEVIQLANKHPRVNIHQPGPGVGGHCLAIDPYFISAEAPEIAKIIRLSRDTNKSMPAFVVEKIEKMLGDAKDPKIAIMGTAYKGNIDDRRESPALEVIAQLQEKGYTLAVNDDHVGDPAYVSMEKAASGADIMVVLTDHDEYKKDRLHALTGMMKTPLIFDTRNIVSPAEGIRIVNFGSLSKA